MTIICSQNNESFFQEYAENVSDDEKASTYDDDILDIEKSKIESESKSTDLMTNLCSTQQPDKDEEKLLDLW